MKLICAILIFLFGCAGGTKYHNDDEYYRSRGLVNQCTANPGSCYPAGTYTDPALVEQLYQVDTYYSQQEDTESWPTYAPSVETEPDQPNTFYNPNSGNSYMRLGDGWYMDFKGNSIRNFGEKSYIDDNGKMYMPFGDWYIDPQGNTLIPQ
jgi:hypothetical protein